ncbi:little elongation complex subunit 2-like [Penaeus indicus]|uniref:little elongation complex subunit 2-like n=1 Tax=Penaeus indicus TaxID=29960 RepID=UPI00300DB749
MEQSQKTKAKKGQPLNADSVTFIPGLFKPPPRGFIPIDANDPFIAGPEVLQQECSLFQRENATRSQEIKEILKFSENDWKEIAEVQIEREKQLREKEQAEMEKAAAIKAVDQKIKQNLDRKVDLLFNKHEFFVKKQCPVLIPYKSSLNHAEHQAYLRAFVKFKIRTPKTACEATEYEQYMRLQNRVYEEQKMFMDFSFQVSRLQLESYNFIPKLVNEYVNEYVQHRSRRATKYMPIYFQEQEVPIRPQDPSNRLSNLQFQHLGHLLSLGSVPWLKLPNVHKLNKLNLDESVLKTQPPVPKEKLDKENTLSGTVCEDPNAIYLAQKHQANIVICTSALKTLADNHGPNFDNEWDIPVRVQSYSIEDDNGEEKSHRVVFIDKPMPKKTWAPLEKKQLFYKKAALASLTEIKRLNVFRMKSPPLFKHDMMDQNTIEVKDQVNYDDDFLDLTSVANHDVFGIDSNVNESDFFSSPKRKNDTEEVKSNKISRKKVAGKKSQDKGKSPSKSVSDDPLESTKEQITASEVSADRGNTESVKPLTSQSFNSGSFLEDLIDLQDSLLKPLQTQNSPVKAKEGETDADPVHPWPWSNKLQTDWSSHGEAKSCELWTGKNKHYQLFSMGPRNLQPNASCQDLRIIVIHNVHGISRFKSKKIKSKAYIVYPKIENQPYFGCEVNTLSEITQQWINLLVAPSTTLLQVRVCESSGEVLLSEEKTLPSVIREGQQPHIGFAPQPHLLTLYSVFCAVTGLSSGAYLLHHDAKTEAFIKLMRAGDADRLGHLQAFNLHSSYALATPTTRPYTVPPWLAIDTHLLTPFHYKHYKIPATFPMDNPDKKLTTSQKKLKNEKAKNKKKLADLEKMADEEDENQKEKD